MQIKTWFISFRDDDNEWEAYSHVFSDSMASIVMKDSDEDVRISSIGYMEIGSILRHVSDRDVIDDLIDQYPELDKYTYNVYSDIDHYSIVKYCPLSAKRDKKIKSIL